MKSKLMTGLMLLAVSFSMVSCDGERQRRDIDGNQQSRDIDVLRIGILPDQTGDASANPYQGIFDRLEEETGIRVELVVPPSYEALTEMFRREELDLAYFGAVTFLKAHREHGASPLVMRDVDMNFTSHFLVKNDSKATKISDLRGGTLAFGSKLSTSGHLMPRHFMKQDNIVPEEFFGEVLYSGAHDRTALWVRDGKADIGVANSKVVDRMYRDGVLTQDQVRILSTTAPYPDYVWAIQVYVPEDLRIEIGNVFTDLSRNNARDQEILIAAGASHFVPASMEDFEGLQKIADQLQIFSN